MILYNYFRSSASYRVRLAFEIKNIPYEYRPVHLLKREQQSEEFLKLNPLKQVPCLVDDSITLTQSMAICQYLDLKYQDKALLPQKNAVELGYVLEFCEIINCTQPLQNLSVLEYLEHDLNLAATEKNAWLNNWLPKSLFALEIWLKKHSGLFCFHDQPSLADCFFLPQIFTSRRFEIDLSSYPNILRLETSLNSHFWAKRAHPHNQIDSAK